MFAKSHSEMIRSVTKFLNVVYEIRTGWLGTKKSYM